MTRALIVAAIILLAGGTYIAAAVGHPLFLMNTYDLETP